MMTRVTKTPTARKARTTAARRVQAKDKRFADYSSLKSSTGIVIPEVRKVILDRKKADRVVTANRYSKIYPSEMSRHDWCPRATYYRMTGRPEPPSKSSFTLENVFAEGNSVHGKWQSWLSDTGILWGDWRCVRCSEYVKDSLKPSGADFGPCVGTGWVRINGLTVTENPDPVFEHDWKYKEVTLRSTTLPVSGHADGGLVKHNCLIELKSLGIGSLRFEAPKLVEDHTYDVDGKKIVDVDGIWRDFHRPLPAHIRQGNIYLWMCREMGLPFSRISFVYEFKSNQRAKEFVVPYSHDIVMPMLATAYMIVEHIEKQVPPSCPFDGCALCKAYEKEESVHGNSDGITAL